MDAVNPDIDGRKRLADFIRKRTTQAQFARDVPCSQSHLTLILKGKRGMSLGLAKRISAATGGEVPVDVLPHKAAVEPAQ